VRACTTITLRRTRCHRHGDRPYGARSARASGGGHKAIAWDRWWSANDPPEELLQPVRLSRVEGPRATLRSFTVGYRRRFVGRPPLSPPGPEEPRTDLAAWPGRQNRGRCSPTVRINILIDSRQDYRHVAECPPPDGRRNINIYLQADAVLSSRRPAKPIGLQRHALVTCSVP